jgi:hypothetical protein
MFYCYLNFLDIKQSFGKEVKLRDLIQVNIFHLKIDLTLYSRSEQKSYKDALDCQHEEKRFDFLVDKKP